MKNRVEDDVAVKFAIKHIKEIIEMIGKVKLVFPAYKAIEEELRNNYKSFSEALARKNLENYDGMNRKNKKIVELYEVAIMFSEIAEEVLKEIKALNQGKKSFLVAASIL